MWLSIAVAWACEPELEVQSWIPEEGALPPGALVYVETASDLATAELHGLEDEVHQLEEAELNAPDGWVAFVLDEDLDEGDWSVRVFEADEELGSLELSLDLEAPVGELAEELELYPQVGTELTDEPPYLLCDTAYEGEWVEVTVQLELPESPGNGWVVQVAEKAEPQLWMAWPTYGGTTEASYIVHWTLQESCPRVTLIDPFGREVQNERMDCTVLPKPAGEEGGSYTQNRWDEVCGCATGPGQGGLALLLLGLLAAFARRAR